MAEINSTLGDIRGKVGNLVLYEGKGNKTLLRGWSMERKVFKESQKRHATAFGTLAALKLWLGKVIKIGFPDNGRKLKGYNAFMSANLGKAITVKKKDPEKPVNKRKKATEEFSGTVDHQALRVAAGPLTPPTVELSIDLKRREACFTYKAMVIEAVDCFLDDRIYAVLLDDKEWIASTWEICRRGEDGTLVIPFPERTKAKNVALYVFATSDNGRYASDSICLHVPSRS